MDFEKMAREIVERVGNGDMCSTSLADFVTRDVFQSAIADALRAAATVPEGYVRVGMEDRRLLGTLPMTADGCVAGDEATVWIDLPEKTWYRGKAYTSTMVWQTDGPSACVNVWDCYSTREAAEAAREKGGER